MIQHFSHAIRLPGVAQPPSSLAACRKPSQTTGGDATRWQYSTSANPTNRRALTCKRLCNEEKAARCCTKPRVVNLVFGISHNHSRDRQPGESSREEVSRFRPSLAQSNCIWLPSQDGILRLLNVPGRAPRRCSRPRGAGPQPREPFLPFRQSSDPATNINVPVALVQNLCTQGTAHKERNLGRIGSISSSRLPSLDTSWSSKHVVYRGSIMKPASPARISSRSLAHPPPAASQLGFPDAKVVPIPTRERDVRAALAVAFNPEDLIPRRHSVRMNTLPLQGDFVLLVVVCRRGRLHVAQEQGYCVLWQMRPSMPEAAKQP